MLVLTRRTDGPIISDPKQPEKCIEVVVAVWGR